jgi:curved DNA-binding protein CbpA
MGSKDYYQILGIEKNATDKEIRQAYRNLAASLQTEINSTDPVSLDKIRDITKAYEVLSDPNDRRQYDAQAADVSSQPMVASNSSAIAPQSPKKFRVPGLIVNVLMLVFGVAIGFIGRPLVMPPPDPQAAMLQSVMNTTRHYKGNANAPVTIVEFADFQ